MRQLLLSLSLLVGLPTFAVRKMANVVCFVKFADQEDAEWQHPQDYYEAMFNDSGDNANSVRNYFTDMSYGAMEWNSVLVPLVYVDSHPRSYYCKQTSINPDGYDNYAVASLREQTMLDALCKYVESSISEDAEIDCNGDGKIDNFTVIINGNSEISSNYNLWPSNQKCLWTTPVIHGKKVDCYLKVFDKANGYKALEPQELNTGVLCHEMMHTLNAFDLYSNGKLEPVGVWDLMSDNQKVPQGSARTFVRHTAAFTVTGFRVSGKSASRGAICSDRSIRIARRMSRLRLSRIYRRMSILWLNTATSRRAGTNRCLMPECLSIGLTPRGKAI